MKNCCRFKIGKCSSPFNPQPDENFSIDRKRRDKRTPQCKSCLKKIRQDTKESRNKAIKAWRLRNPEKMREYRRIHSKKIVEKTRKWREQKRLLFLYGISNEQYKEMENQQQGLCKICGRHKSNFKRGLCVDHSHETGKVRGLLCHPCNQAIGLFKEDIERFKRAINYLEDSNGIHRHNFE